MQYENLDPEFLQGRYTAETLCCKVTLQMKNGNDHEISKDAATGAAASTGSDAFNIVFEVVSEENNGSSSARSILSISFLVFILHFFH